MSQLQVTGEAKIRDIQGPVVANSGVITALDGAASQYVRGDGTLADFPTSTGGGSSVSYYLNGSVNQGTIGGVAYKELSKDPILGVGTDFTISANGYVASFITDANDPDSIIVPGGNWNTEIYFSVDSNSNSPYFYVEVYKYDGSTFTLLGSNQTTPEYITAGTTITPYYGAVAIPTTNTAITDRIAIRIYVVPDGRTVTLHTENSHLGQIVTTFSKGMTSLNNLTDQSQYLTTGTSGTDFNIASSGDTHTFNLPVASATNTGKLSSTDWSTFNSKQPAGNYVTLDTTQTITAAKTFTGLVSSIADTNAAAYIVQGRASDDLAQIQYKNNAGSNTKAIINFSSVGTNGGGIQFLVKPQDLPIVSSLTLSPYQAHFDTSVTADGSFTGTSLRILNTIFTSTIGATLTANRTITIPDLTGTIALLEGTQTFSGAKTFSSNIKIDNGVDGNYIGFKQYATGSTATTGFTSLYAISTNVFGIGFGTTKAIQFDSTSLTAIRNYTFPDASGTIALTSNLSSYVPYTGATANVDLGSRTLTSSNNIFASSFVGQLAVILGTSSYGGTVGLYPNATYTLTDGYLNMNASSSTKLNLAFGQGSNVYKYAILDVSGLTNDTNRTYTLPNASGTLALTSDLSGYVTLATTQTITGAKTFSLDILVNSLTIGKGSGSISGNTAIGVSSLNANTTGNQNTAIGFGTLPVNLTGNGNTAIGYTALSNNTASSNTAIGFAALVSNTTGSNNIAIGNNAGNAITTGSNNTIIGNYAGTSAMSNNIVLADGQGNIRYQWNGTNNVFGNPISGTSATFSGLISGSSTNTNGFAFGTTSRIRQQDASSRIEFVTFDASGLYDIAAKAATFSSSVTVGGSVNIASGYNVNFNNASDAFIYSDASGGGRININGTNQLQLSTASAPRLTISNVGNVGIGTSSPTSFSGYTTLTIDNTSGSFTEYRQGGVNTFRVGSNESNGGFLYTQGSTPIRFGTIDTERMRITSDGYLLVGATSGAGFGSVNRISRSTAQGNYVLSVDGGAGQDFSTLFLSVSGGAGSSALAAQWVGRNTSTGRSINAGGTINASGADYAEYMTKAIEDDIAKGDIVGVDANGLLTNIFGDAKSFVVKSTDPSYVGGDAWGVKLEGEELEAARVKVDRIAFSGQVPCNVYGANVGDYIIPIEINGKIAGQAVSNPTFEQYQLSVGKVWKIMEDGRAWIAVKIG